MGVVRETERLQLRHLTVADAPFMLELLNDPDWLRFIGDRGVHTVEEAVAYLERGAMRSCKEHGFGLYLVTRRSDDARTGICGLVRRPGLDDVDLGFAFLPAWRRQGFASEAGAAVMDHAWRDCDLSRVVAITNPDNDPSIGVLGRLGFVFERRVRLTPEASEVNLYAAARPAS